VNYKGKTLKESNSLVWLIELCLYILLFVTKYFHFALIDIVVSPEFIVLYAVWKLVFY